MERVIQIIVYFFICIYLIMKKSVWGPIVWSALHSLSIHIKEDSFASIKDELIDIIYKICSNLPCPSCASHSTSLLKRYRVKQRVKTKQDLIRILCVIHNEVNKRLKKQVVDVEECIRLHKDKSFKETQGLYYKTHINMQFGEKMMLYSFHRKLFLKQFKQFILHRKDCFI